MKYRLAFISFAATLSQHADAFNPINTLSMRESSISKISLSASDEGTDVSIPYDAAARLAYENWRKEYNKGDFDAIRYENFKNNYNFIAINNVKAKKAARESGEGKPKLLALNEYGDYSAEEYEAAMSGSKSSKSSSSAGKLSLGKKQEDVASLLSEASDGLLEEEAILAEKLGINSLDELEAILDAMEGIDEEGILQELDTEESA